MTMYEVFNALKEKKEYKISEIVEFTNGSEEETIFYLNVLDKLQMVEKKSPSVSGIVNVNRIYSIDEYCYKIK